MLITTAHDDIFITFETYVEWSYITCTHIAGRSWYDTMIVPRPILYFTQAQV